MVILKYLNTTMTYCFIGWIDWLIDINPSINWLTRSIDPINWSIEWLTDLLIDWLAGRVTDSLSHSIIYWLIDGLSDWLTDWLIPIYLFNFFQYRIPAVVFWIYSSGTFVFETKWQSDNGMKFLWLQAIRVWFQIFSQTCTFHLYEFSESWFNSPCFKHSGHSNHFIWT